MAWSTLTSLIDGQIDGALELLEWHFDQLVVFLLQVVVGVHLALFRVVFDGLYVAVVALEL